MADSTTTVAALKEAMARFVAERSWEPFHTPKNLAMGLAVEAAGFGTPEINVGVWPMVISAVLARNLSRKALLEMMLLGDRFTAAQMHAYAAAARAHVARRSFGFDRTCGGRRKSVWHERA